MQSYAELRRLKRVLEEKPTEWLLSKLKTLDVQAELRSMILLVLKERNPDA